jgi:UDP-2,4-diacetamido-2,4,6-trideoxy-beta-L-altropyranose hydrolase
VKYDKPIITIRTDASAQIGLGHLVRCISLAQAFKSVYDIKFFCNRISSVLEKELRANNFELHKITKESEFFHYLDSSVITILDGYGFDFNYQKKVKETGAKLVCIDDLAEGEFAADLIINQSPGVQKSDYKALPETQFALGPDYALLRSPFFRQNVEFSSSNHRKNLLICFGGSDVQNITENALKLALDFKEFDKITIITGSAYRHEESMSNTIKNCDICEYYHAVEEQKMAELMFSADVAIVPASGILFEALVTKNVVISGMYIENQKRNYEAFRDNNAFIDAGRFASKEIERAFKKVKTFNPAAIVDGKSPDRFRKLFKKISLKN